MARVITKELAVKILKKLCATKSAGGGSAHDEYAVEVEGVVVAVTSLRRGSEKDLGHDHMARDLNVGPNFAKQLGQCTTSAADYAERLREQGVLRAGEGGVDQA